MKTKLLFYAIQKLKNGKTNSIYSLLIIFFMTISSFGQTLTVNSDCVVGNFPNLTFEFEIQNTTGENIGTVSSNGGELANDWKLVVVQANPNPPDNYERWEIQNALGQRWFYTTDIPLPNACNANWVIDTIIGGGRPCTDISITCSGDPDNDGDGFNASEDCDDSNAAINPGADEVPYNGKDDDCNPETLDDDLDQDGYDNAYDCNDLNEDIYPEAPEICDGLDNDCDVDGAVDEDIADCNNGVILEYCNDKKTKILVCHNGKDICVSINALDAHEAHGDYIGSCANAREGEVLIDEETPISYNLVSWPNPTNNLFNIKMITPNYEDKVNLQAFDINGRLIHSKIINGNEDYQFGTNIESGVYFVKVTQASTTEVIRIIKR